MQRLIAKCNSGSSNF